MRDLSRVCHLGSLNTKSPGRPGRLAGESYEGNGLSISVTPKAWRRIARLGDSKSYVLTKENPNFADGHDRGTRKEAIKWCKQENLLEPVKTWKVPVTNEDGEIEGWCVCFSQEEAMEEAESGGWEPEDIKQAKGWKFSELGGKYFDKDTDIPHQIADDYAVILWAEAHGFDGVWWEDNYDPDGLSAPRGVIFQNKLEGWTIKRGTVESEYDDYEEYDE